MQKRILIKLRQDRNCILYHDLVMGLCDTPDSFDGQCCLYVKESDVFVYQLFAVGFSSIVSNHKDYLYFPIDGFNPKHIRKAITSDWVNFIDKLRAGIIISR